MQVGEYEVSKISNGLIESLQVETSLCSPGMEFELGTSLVLILENPINCT